MLERGVSTRISDSTNRDFMYKIAKVYENITWNELYLQRQQESPAIADKPVRRESLPIKNCSNSTCLQRRRRQFWPIFIRLAVVASEICEIPRNSLKIQTYGV